MSEQGQDAEESTVHFEIDVKAMSLGDIERIKNEVAARIADELRAAAVAESTCEFGSHYSVRCEN